ncbi:ATP-binding protein [Embleya sp. AB8]|uniref:ATP-binding protein n=1 Tax=Embleya sp. AB8 TaxID=3156304 RepID=UPI003C79068B
MVLAGSSPGGRRPALAWVLPLLVTAACAAAAVAAVSAQARPAVALCGAIATVAVAVCAAETSRRGRTIAQLQVRLKEQQVGLRRRLAAQEAETLKLAEELVPEAIGRLQMGEAVPEVLRKVAPERDAPTEFALAHRTVLRSVIDAVSTEEELRESTQRAFVNIARRVQATIHQQAQDMRGMEDRHGDDPVVFRDLLHLDHGNALIGRMADSIAVLGGSHPGRQWEDDIGMYSVLRGAMSRILDYRRVKLHSVVEVAVLSRHVEPLIHAIAELLDNATRYSPPSTTVQLSTTEVQSGIAVEIEDAGVGLSEEARRRAERILSLEGNALTLDDLGETPRLGLTVVARLARDNDFKVMLRPSAYSGVRAVVVIPQYQITPNVPPMYPMPEHLSHLENLPTLEDMIADAATNTEVGANGLPQRRRRTLGTVPRAASPRGGPRKSSLPPVAPSFDETPPGLGLDAFLSGINGEPPPGERRSEPGDDTWREGGSR